MLIEYETSFTILETSELTGTALLTDVADNLESLLADSRSDAAPISTERELSSSSGYAIYSADRLHPHDPEHILRIQARFCTKGQAVTAQIRSRFISADDNDPADLTAGPPRILDQMVNKYECAIGPYRFNNEVIQVDDDDMADNMMKFIMESSRKIPVLILTEYFRGGTAIEPQAVLNYLLGLALVVRFRGRTAYRIKEATGRRCDNGGMRFYWPGDSSGKFYWAEDATRNGLTKYQRDVIANADFHDLNGDFEEIFSKTRTRVIREQREETHRQTDADLRRAKSRVNELENAEREYKQRIDDLLEQLNDLKSSPITPSDSERNKEVIRQRAEIVKLRREKKADENTISALTSQIRRTEESLERAEVETAVAKIPVIIEDAQGISLTGKTQVDNITILNHAINIYRDPARRYIIRALRNSYDDNALCEIIERTMRNDSDRRRLRQAIANNRPHDGIDVGHFENIVMESRKCFDNNRLTTRLGEVARVRNTAAHPGIDGINSIMAKDGINKVVRALKEMNNNNDSKLVEQLLSFVR
jgi:hypothetical protein